MTGFLASVRFKTPLAGLDELVLGSVHFHQDRVKKPVAGQMLVDRWLKAVSDHSCDIFGFDANQGVPMLVRSMAGVIIKPAGGKNCVGLRIPKNSRLIEHVRVSTLVWVSARLVSRYF